jgi:hypothetical protein
VVTIIKALYMHVCKCQREAPSCVQYARKETTAQLKMGKRSERHFTKEEIKMADKQCDDLHCTPQSTEVQNEYQVLWNHRNSSSLLVGMQNGAATLEDSLKVSFKAKTYLYHMIQKLCSVVFTQRS